MAHHDTRQPTCANCHYAFVPGEPNEFCPRCGQQNHAPDLRFGHVVEEVLEGLLHLDGKVFRTARLLLFKPGELTRLFLAGHRAPYLPPIRLYMFISFVFFFALSLQHGKPEKNKPAGQQTTERKVRLQRAISAWLDSLGETHPARPTTPSQLPARRGVHVTRNEHPDDKHFFSLSADSTSNEHSDDEPTISFDGDSLLQQLPANATQAQIDEVIRSDGDEPGYWNRLFAKRYLHWLEISPEERQHQVLRGTSMLVFVLMPLAALLLKLGYVRRKHHYLAHLIFTIHLHSFLFVLLLLNLGIGWLPSSLVVKRLLVLVGLAYFVVALHRVYAQGWGKTLVKATILSLGYALLAVVAVLGVGTLGFVLF